MADLGKWQGKLGIKNRFRLSLFQYWKSFSFKNASAHFIANANCHTNLYKAEALSQGAVKLEQQCMAREVYWVESKRGVCVCECGFWQAVEQGRLWFALTWWSLSSPSWSCTSAWPKRWCHFRCHPTWTPQRPACSSPPGNWPPALQSLPSAPGVAEPWWPANSTEKLIYNKPCINLLTICWSTTVNEEKRWQRICN